MRRVLLAGALWFGACWTGADTPVAEPETQRPVSVGEPMKLRVKLERTVCFGTCPAYTLLIDGWGRVEWTGHSHVAAVGKRYGKVTRRELDELSRRLDRARFFERDQFGGFPETFECVKTGTATSCSFGTSVTICSDTSHTIFTVTRDGESHKIDNDHCKDTPELDALEAYIDKIARTASWIEP